MRTINLLTACCLTMCLFASCGGITVKGENGQKYDSYQECCAANDFEAAHQYLAKMHNAADKYEEWNEYRTAKEYVFRQEALFLMSQNDEAAKKRIIYLLKEEDEGNNDSYREDVTNKHISMLIDLAIENDDEEYVKTLANHYKKEVNNQELRKLYDYLVTKNEENKTFLINLFKKLSAKKMILLAAIESDNMQLLQEYASALSLNDEEVIARIAKKKNNTLSEIILGLLSPEEKYIHERPSLGITSYYWSHEKEAYIDKCESYESSVSSYNRKCLKIMNIGIQCKNRNLAQRAIGKMKSNIFHKELDPRNEYYRIQVTTGDNSEIIAARKLLDDAARSGAFK